MTYYGVKHLKEYEIIYIKKAPGRRRRGQIKKKRFIKVLVSKLFLSVVPEVGIEPTWGCPRGILSPVRLPVSPLRHDPPITRNPSVLSIK